MDFSTFFSKQARKPSGFFGRYVMSAIFNIGNAYLNRFVSELLSVQPNDHVLDIGCGTGKLIYHLALQINDGYFEGIDFSDTMVSLAEKRNRKNIVAGRVNIKEADFNKLSYESNIFDKCSSVNTLYFWPEPEVTAHKIADILKPGGIFVVAFEDIKQLAQRNLNKDVFRLYSVDDVKNLLASSGFSGDIRQASRRKGKQTFHCVVAQK